MFAGASPTTRGIPFLMIPPFSTAICSTVEPKSCVWSRLMFVMTERIGVIILVLSNLPPNPTSTMAMSTPLSLKYLNAIIVAISKNDEPTDSNNSLPSSTNWTT